jgi:hypothetical protein
MNRLVVSAFVAVVLRLQALKTGHVARYRLASSMFRFVAFDRPAPGYSLAEDFAKRVMEG